MFKIFTKPITATVDFVKKPTLSNLVAVVTPPLVPTPATVVENVVAAAKAPTLENIIRAVPAAPLAPHPLEIVEDAVKIKNEGLSAVPQVIIKNVANAAGINDAAYVVVEAYLASLQLKARNQFKNLPAQLVAAISGRYSVNLNDVRYAENIDIGLGGNAIAFPGEIFFPRAIDPLNNREDLHWLLHELTHQEQYQRTNGLRGFLANYTADALAKIISRGTFDIHDHLQYEREAESKADQLTDEVWNQLQSIRPNLSC